MKHAQGFTTLAGALLTLSLMSHPLQAADKPAPEYPNTSRVAPKLDLTSADEQKKLQAGLDAVSVNDKAVAEDNLQPLVENSKSKYAQALALQGLATIKYKAGDTKGAITELQQALTNGVLPNDTYFDLEYMLAQFQIADEQYQSTVDTVEKWRTEGKKETADSYALEGNAYYRLNKYPEAIAAIKKAESLTDKPKSTWNQILMASYAESGQSDQASQLASQQYAANPNDADARKNYVTLLMQANKYPEAIQVMEKARASGSLTTETDYVNLAKMYIISAQSSNDSKPDATKAVAVLNDGIGKQVVPATAPNYLLLGEANELSDNVDAALGAYNKAIPLARDGEASLRAGQLYLTSNKYAQAKTLLQQAIDKGVKHKGSAYMELAESKRGLKDKAGAIAAMKMAAQDPETADKANAWLKKAAASK